MEDLFKIYQEKRKELYDDLRYDKDSEKEVIATPQADLPIKIERKFHIPIIPAICTPEEQQVLRWNLSHFMHMEKEAIRRAYLYECERVTILAEFYQVTPDTIKDLTPATWLQHYPSLMQKYSHRPNVFEEATYERAFTQNWMLVRALEWEYD